MLQVNAKRMKDNKHQAYLARFCEFHSVVQDIEEDLL